MKNVSQSVAVESDAAGGEQDETENKSELDIHFLLGSRWRVILFTIASDSIEQNGPGVIAGEHYLNVAIVERRGRRQTKVTWGDDIERFI